MQKTLNGIIPSENRIHVPNYYTSSDGIGHAFVIFDIYVDRPVNTLDAGKFHSIEGRHVTLIKKPNEPNPQLKTFDQASQSLLRVDEFSILSEHISTLKNLDDL